MRVTDPGELSAVALHKLLAGSVVPRPIAWVSTADREGVPNLAPFSFFTIVSVSPPMLAITVQAPEDRDGEKDTLVNIRATGEFVVNAVSAPLADAMWISSHAHARDVDEFALSGVSRVASHAVGAPRVGEALVSMECVVSEIIRPGGDSVVIGRVACFDIDDGLLDERGRIDVTELQPLGRLGGTYARVQHDFVLPTRDGDVGLSTVPAR